MRRLVERLFGPAGILMMAHLAGAGIGLALQVLLARGLGTGDLGTFYVAVSVIGTCSVIGAAAIHPWPIVSWRGTGPGGLGYSCRLSSKPD
jgi:O-antigen/teichoic acid export membrane protein